MKRIEFGYTNEENAKGAWEGIGIKPGLLLTDADYYGAIKYDDNSYIIAKIVKDEYGHYPNLLGNFIVRPALADLYADGSGTLFLDQEQSFIGQHIENYLNHPQVKERITNINDVLRYVNGAIRSDLSFEYLTSGNEVITTSITHSAFEEKNNALKSCRMSFSDLQQHYQLSQTNGFQR